MTIRDLHDPTLAMPPSIADTMAIEASRKLAAEQEAIIRQCIDARLNYEPWTLEEIIPRLRWLVDERNAKAPKVLTLDGVGILEIWPVENGDYVEGMSNFMKWTVKWRKLG